MEELSQKINQEIKNSGLRSRPLESLRQSNEVNPSAAKKAANE